MPIDFKNKYVIVFESRRADEMQSLIQRCGGIAFSAPTIREVKNQDTAPVLAFADQLFKVQIDTVIFLTGVGTKMMFETIATAHSQEELVEALQKTTTIARGPKPVATLRTFGVTPTHTVPEPNTWEDLLATLDEQAPVKDKTVAVQEYGMTNDRLVKALTQRGGSVVRVPVYQWALPEDLTPLHQAIERICRAGNESNTDTSNDNADIADITMFTSATQVYHLFQVARTLPALSDGTTKEQALLNGFKRTFIASIGPVCSEAITDHGLTVDYEPDMPHMAPLVRETARRSDDLLSKKRTAANNGIDTNNWKRVDMRWDNAETSIADSVFMKAARCEPASHTPVWIMRQAGRYQREYRKLRKGVTLLELCHTPELAAEVTLMAVDRLGTDAAIIFSDILPIVEPLGFNLEYVKGEGPVIHNPVREPTNVTNMLEADASSMNYVYEALSITRRALRPDIALIGFCGAPFTIASYMIEGGKSKDYAKTKTMMFRDPKSWNLLMEKLTDLLIDYMNRQAEAGADALQIFDSWAGSLSPDHYREHILPHIKRLISGIKRPTPVINFLTGNPALLPLMKEAGGDVIGLDWRVDLAEAWQSLGDNVAVMGNLDPTVLYCSQKEIREQTQTILDKAGGKPGLIFNLGHGVSPDMSPENVADLIDAVHELSANA